MPSMRILLVATVVLVSAAACGASGPDEESGPAPTVGGGTRHTIAEPSTTEPDDEGVASAEDPYVEAFQESLSTGEVTATEESAECIAESWVHQLGAERLEDAGLTPSGIESGNEGTFFAPLDSVSSCSSLPRILNHQTVSVAGS